MDKYSEQFRPQFHFSPLNNWMNDPNGLVYYKGLYHLFYQYYPNDIVWGSMHWGHAISKDLIYWEHKPIALFPDELGDIFSGSVVVDTMNSSGLGSKTNPPLVAIFTYHSMEGENAGRIDYQTQGIAYSMDNGDTWKKYSDNPVIKNTGYKDFRDPKVFWDGNSKQWILVLVAGNYVKFYKSDDLINWKHSGDFGKETGAHGGVWECPDLFEITVDGTNEKKWVLIISIDTGAPNGGSGTQYFIGDFDGNTFTCEHDDVKWIDLGTDNYAGITYNNTPTEKRICIAWMSNWQYGQEVPTKPWRGAMTLPRELSLVKEHNQYVVHSHMVPSFQSIKTNVLKRDTIDLTDIFIVEHPNFNQSEISFVANLSKNIRLQFKNAKGECLILEINPLQGEIIVDRRKSGFVNFEKRFANKIHVCPYKKGAKDANISIVLDWSSVEFFVDNGKYVMTDLLFPSEFYNVLEISSDEKNAIGNFNINAIESVWKEKPCST